MKEIIDEVGQQNDSVHAQATGEALPPKALKQPAKIDATGMELVTDIKVHRGSDKQIHVTINGHTMPATTPAGANKQLTEFFGSVFVR